MQSHAASLHPIQDSPTSRHAIRETSAPDMAAAQVVREPPSSDADADVVVAPADVTAERTMPGMASSAVSPPDEETPRSRKIRSKPPAPEWAPHVDVAGPAPDESDPEDHDTHDSP